MAGAQNGEVFPRIVAALPEDEMYLVALTDRGELSWARILNRDTGIYYRRVRLGNALVMTGPWEAYTGSQDVLPVWIAAAHDQEADDPGIAVEHPA